MRKIKGLALTLVAFFTSISIVSAECDATETNRLNKLAANVKTSVEKVEVESEEGTYEPPDSAEWEDYVEKDTYFYVYISNITEDIYITVYDTLTKETKKYTYADTDKGQIVIKNGNLREKVKYTITVYSANSNCYEQKLRTLEAETPMYNFYSAYMICEGNEEHYLCHEYTTVELPDLDEFSRIVNKYAAEKKQEEEEKKEEEKNKGFINFIKNNKVAVIITSTVIIIGGVGITYVILKKQRSKKYEKDDTNI